jgi:hypothetical protein
LSCERRGIRPALLRSATFWGLDRTRGAGVLSTPSE